MSRQQQNADGGDGQRDQDEVLEEVW